MLPEAYRPGGRALCAGLRLRSHLPYAWEWSRRLVVLAEGPFLCRLGGSGDPVCALHYQQHMPAISRRPGMDWPTFYRKLKELGLHDEAA
jgi:hypothetical protein